MRCTRCGAEGGIRNGGNRGLCKAGDHSFKLAPEQAAQYAGAVIEARNGIAPEHGLTVPVPAGYLMGKVTVQAAGGNVERTWMRMSPDDLAQQAAMQAFLEVMAEPLKGLAKPIRAPKTVDAEMLSAYLIGDGHFGLYAWSKEAGEDFDTSIASKDLRAAIDRLVDRAPASRIGYLVDVGDFLHADSRIAATPQSGNMLDVDGRFPRVVRIATDALKYCIGRMLQKHELVEVFITPGNHNPNSAGMMAMILEAFYTNEPRVKIEDSPGVYYYRKFGNNLIGITHGDKVKLAELPSIMATDRPKEWGDTEHRFWWTGHIHHTKHQEYRGCFVESFNTLAASDAWHHASGYRSKRQMQRIDLHIEDGIESRGIAGIGMIRRAPV